MKSHAWFTLCFASFLAAYALIAGAFEVDHSAISNRVFRQTAKVFGQDAVKRVIDWNDLIKNNKDKPIAEKLALTNEFFNRIPIKSDKELWGHTHWSTPYEMLTRNAGSHADHVIGKYVTLEALGIGIQHLHITHVHSAATSDPSYMVLTYNANPGDMPLVLDTVKGEIKPANERKDLVPEDSLNDDGVWLSNKQSDGRNDAQPEATGHIELWHEMNERMDKELLYAEDPSSN